MPSAQDIHRAHQPGSESAFKLALAVQLNQELKAKVSLQAQANLREGIRLALQAAGVAPDALGRRIFEDLAGAMGDVRLALASGKPPELALAGGGSLVARFADVAVGDAQVSLQKAAGAVALAGSAQVRASLPLVNTAVALSAQASAKGISFTAGVALPLIRGVALRGTAQWDGRKVELRLGLAGRIQARRGG